MYYGEIKKFDISNGEGVRVSIFVSGCRVHCPGCFNKCTWDFQYGKLFTEETENEITEALSKEFISGLTVLGGEPFEPENQEVLAPFLSKVKKMFPKKTIWCYTGFLFETLVKQPHTRTLLQYIDVLVDGPFVESLKDTDLLFRGSSNQRLIDVQKSLKEGKVVLWQRKQRFAA